MIPDDSNEVAQISATPVVDVVAEAGSEPSMASKWRKTSFDWVREIKNGYFTNPTAKRDFRVQFRGKGSIWIFGFIALIFTGVALYLFHEAGANDLGPSAIQQGLAVFCGVMLVILGGAITLIAPALAATSILVEKQRRSLDLVFTSPVKPKHYLFGKLIASYRFVWVLMGISLPFTALSVIMGGGTWVNILEAYVLLSAQGLLFTSIGIYFSSLVEKTISALFYTYVTVIGLCVGMGALTAALMPTNNWNLTPFQGGGFPLWASFVPVLVEFATGTGTSIGGLLIPNTLLALVVVGGAVNLILRAAGGLLTPLSQRERTQIRTQTGLIAGAVSGLIGFIELNAQSIADGGRIPANTVGFLLATAPLIFFVPFLSCYAPDAEQKQGHDRLFNWRHLFGKSVAGALPYIYSYLGFSTVCFLIGSFASNKLVDINTILELVYGFGFWTFIWSTARFASSFLNGIKAARTLQLLTFAGIVGAPLPIFVWLSTLSSSQEWIEKLWQFNPLSPLIYHVPALATLIHTILLFSLGGGLAKWSEKNYVKRREARRLSKVTDDSSVIPEGELQGFAKLAHDEDLMHRLVQGS